MNNYLDPAFNFFTSGKFNRLSLRRSDFDWIKSGTRNENSKFIILSSLKILTGEDPSLHAVFLSTKDIPSNINIDENAVFLGGLNGVHYFGLDITPYETGEKFLSFGVFKELRSIAPFIDRDTAAVLAYARAMINWHSNHKYCGVCGHSTIITDAGHKRVCTNPVCAREHFPRTDPAVIMLVERNGKCLLARQAKWPQGQFSTIAGFVEPGESLEQAVQREVLEETGIRVEKIRYHSSQPWPFPAAIMLGFRAEAVNDDIKLGDHELETAGWFSRHDIIEKMQQGIIRFPTTISISFQLIQDWFNEEEGLNLEMLAKKPI